MNLQEAAELLGISTSQLLRQARDPELLPHLISKAYNQGIQDASTHIHTYYRSIVSPRAERDAERERRINESQNKLYALTRPE